MLSKEYQPLLTSEKLKIIMHNCKQPEKWTENLLLACNRYEINNKKRLACFLAQIAVESGELNRVVENLNYSADGLMRVWPKRFDEALAKKYHRQPEKIANFVYAGRNGNGNEASGDGWRFRGRGLIQITGRGNYVECEKATGILCVINPEILEVSEFAALSAAWFFSEKANGNKLADNDDAESFIRLTKNINGGTLHLAERKAFWDLAKRIL